MRIEITDNKAVAKAVRYHLKKRHTDRVSVKFPNNDYIINGKVKLCSPTATRKVFWDGPYGPYVRFDKRRFYLKVSLLKFENHKHRAIIYFETK